MSKKSSVIRFFPSATYRLQFNREFTFQKAKEILPYLQRLGISHLYASPIFKAVPGSMHGYDVLDPNEINPELGGEKGFVALAAAAQRLGLGWIQDIVPNHMAYHGQNAWLADLFERNLKSPYRHHFDINWQPSQPALRGKVLAPFLGAYYADCLQRGELKIRLDSRGFHVTYYDLAFPLLLETYASILDFDTRTVAAIFSKSQQKKEVYRKFSKTFTSLGLLSGHAARIKIENTKREFWEFYQKESVVRKAVRTALDRINGKVGVRESFRSLDKLLARQVFCLAYWRVSMTEINYRRFFNINQLISVRAELPMVFSDSHRMLFRLADEGFVHGVRVDHLDGLYEPQQYLARLRKRLKSHYIVVEKILGKSESPPIDWPIQGTTGYGTLNMINGLFIRPEASAPLTHLYHRFTKKRADIEDLSVAKKRLILNRHMAGDLENLATEIRDSLCMTQEGRDVPVHRLKKALIEILCFFPRYRTYVDADGSSDEDSKIIQRAAELARRLNPLFAHEINLIRELLLFKKRGSTLSLEEATWLHLVKRFQQYTGPIMAKGVEDTALYVFNRFISLNEVGGHPGQFGVRPDEFHRFMLERFEKWPASMSASMTHDAKRGEDFRAGLNILSEIPGEWARAVVRWQHRNARHKTLVNGTAYPDSNDEYFIYQTLFGSFPEEPMERRFYLPRLQAYLVKALREAKGHTSWLEPNESYESAVLLFSQRILNDVTRNGFFRDFTRFQNMYLRQAKINGLSQTILKIFAVGIPDFYQGTEYRDLSFVDPDNRRPVDYGRSRRLLRKFQSAHARDNVRMPMERDDAKLFLLSRLLPFRRRYGEFFQRAAYVPLVVTGASAAHCFAFARVLKKQVVIIAVARFLNAPLQHKGKGWESFFKKAFIPNQLGIVDGDFLEVITGKEVVSTRGLRADELFRRFSGAVLARMH